MWKDSKILPWVLGGTRPCDRGRNRGRRGTGDGREGVERRNRPRWCCRGGIEGHRRHRGAYLEVARRYWLGCRMSLSSLSHMDPDDGAERPIGEKRK